MSRVLMRQVYPAIWESEKVLIARTEGRERARFGFEDFRREVLGMDLIVTRGTAASKWQIAIAEGVVYPANPSNPLGIATIDLQALAEKVGEPYTPKRVCEVCVCENGRTSEGRGLR